LKQLKEALLFEKVIWRLKIAAHMAAMNDAATIPAHHSPNSESDFQALTRCMLGKRGKNNHWGPSRKEFG
jgi:hypothetical protein